MVAQGWLCDPGWITGQVLDASSAKSEVACTVYTCAIVYYGPERKRRGSRSIGIKELPPAVALASTAGVLEVRGPRTAPVVLARKTSPKRLCHSTSVGTVYTTYSLSGGYCERVITSFLPFTLSILRAAVPQRARFLPASLRLSYLTLSIPRVLLQRE